MLLGINIMSSLVFISEKFFASYLKLTVNNRSDTLKCRLKFKIICFTTIYKFPFIIQISSNAQNSDSETIQNLLIK